MASYTDYLFLLSPPGNIKREISRYKKESLEFIGEFGSSQSPAHITVNQLKRQNPYLIGAAFEQIESRLHAMPAVLLHLDGFKYFEHPHGKKTIYAHIRSTPAMEDWFTLLRKNLHINKAFVPHITVVRNILQADFDKLWPNFKNRKLLEPFWICELKVMQRKSYSITAGKWEPYKTIVFKNTDGFAGTDNWVARTQDEAEKAAWKQIKLF